MRSCGSCRTKRTYILSVNFTFDCLQLIQFIQFLILKFKKHAWPLKMGPIGSPETSVFNQPALRNIPKDYRIQANCNESLRPRLLYLLNIGHSDWVTDWNVRDSNPGTCKKSCPVSQRSDRFCDAFNLLSIGTGAQDFLPKGNPVKAWSWPLIFM